MPRKKFGPKNPPRRPRGTSFEASLRLARRMYEEKTQRRQDITQELEELNLAIPLLEKTLRALEAQLGEGIQPVDMHVPKQFIQHAEKIKRQMEQLTGATIPPDVRAKLPPEDLSNFGSHFGDGPQQGEDFLPEIEGKEVVPTKKQ